MSFDRDWEPPDEDFEPSFGMMIMLVVGIIIIEHWRTIVGLGIVAGVLAVQALTFHHPIGLFGSMAVSGIVAVLAVVSSWALLENQNCQTTTTVSLWKRKGVYKLHGWMAVGVTIIVVGAWQSFVWSGVTINTAALLSVIIGYPALIVVIGFLATGSQARIVSEETYRQSYA